jgi:adenylosuccinate synthase
VPLSIVVGGQFGSEGKGKVACFLAKERQARAVVRVGGPNSGHTVIDQEGRRRIFRQLPTAAILDHPVCVLAAGSYIDLDVLRAEISQTRLTSARLKIDPKAVIITPDCKEQERNASLKERVGSTQTGTGAAVGRRIARNTDVKFASAESELQEFLADTAEFLDECLGRGERVVAEGSQGFGLSVIHTPYFPFATSRDTTASGVLSEIGLSPFMVDEIALVIRAFPIRVPGNSGPLPRETEWGEISKSSGSFQLISELTSVTRSQRRVAHFDPDVVRAAIRANAPSLLFMNHIDYVDATTFLSGRITKKVEQFVGGVETELNRRVDFIGLGPAVSIPFTPLESNRTAA